MEAVGARVGALEDVVASQTKELLAKMDIIEEDSASQSKDVLRICAEQISLLKAQVEVIEAKAGRSDATEAPHPLIQVCCWHPESPLHTLHCTTVLQHSAAMSAHGRDIRHHHSHFQVNEAVGSGPL